MGELCGAPDVPTAPDASRERLSGTAEERHGPMGLMRIAAEFTRFRWRTGIGWTLPPLERERRNQSVAESALKTDSRQIATKHHGKRAIIRDQRTRPVSKIDNLAKSAKPPSPVQIRAAPPT